MAMNYALRPGTTQKVSPSGSSAATATAFGSQTEYVRVAADAAITFEVGGTAMTNSAITVEYDGSAAGDVDSSEPSAANRVEEVELSK